MEKDVAVDGRLSSSFVQMGEGANEVRDVGIRRFGGGQVRHRGSDGGYRGGIDGPRRTAEKGRAGTLRFLRGPCFA